MKSFAGHAFAAIILGAYVTVLVVATVYVVLTEEGEGSSGDWDDEDWA